MQEGRLSKSALNFCRQEETGSHILCQRCEEAGIGF